MLSQSTSSNPNNSVFVAASAGSGKTTVLTNRVLRLLLSGTNPSKILCLTFTKVAANQMQNRILSKLEDWVIFDDEKLRAHLTELTGNAPSSSQMAKARKLFSTLLDDSQGIQISTIHAFCQSIIQKFPLEAKSTPNFLVIDEQKENELLQKARDKLLGEALNNQNLKDKIHLISSELNEESFLEISSELLKKRYDLAFLKEKYFDINGVIEGLFRRIGIDKNENEISVFNDFVSDNTWRKDELLDLFVNGGIKKSDIVKNFINTSKSEDLLAYINVFLTTENEPRKKIVTKPIEKNFPHGTDLVTLEQTRIVKFLEKYNSVKIATLTAFLLIVTDRIIEIYNQLKSREGYLDYSDLIIKTSELLENSANREWIKYKLDGTYEHILIDESQDTNHQQWNIIKAITEEFFSGAGSFQNQNPTIFIVGDEKQSIYSFQGAEPDIFSDIFHYYQEKLELVNKKLLNINLNTSFRSFPAILETVDKVFTKPELTSAISTLTSEIKHFAHKNKTIGKVELLPIVSCKSSDEKNGDEYRWKLDFEENNALKEREILAKLITNKIKKLFSENKFLASKNRPIQFGDVMILLKERKSDLENLLIQNLSDAGIPVAHATKFNFSENIVIQDLLSLARFVLLTSDDLNLACLLKSPFFNVNEEELEKLCQIKNLQNISLFVAIKDSNKALFLELEDLIYQNQKQQFSIQEFFSYVLIYKNKQAEFFKSENNSKEIIDHLFNVIISYQANNIGTSLQGFVTFIENSDLEIKIDNFDQNQNKIYITTVHSSKGLEAPIVFIADAAHSAQSKNNKKKIFWDPKSKLPFWSRGADYDNADIEEIKEYEKNVVRKEYWRQLYVAMTRAEEELYICGYGAKYNENCWYEVIRNSIANDAAKIDKSSYGADLDNYLINDGLLIGKASEQENSGLDDAKQFVQDIRKLDQNQLDQIPSDENEEEFLYPSTLNEPGLSDQNNNLGKVIHKILEILIKTKSLEKSEEFIRHYLDEKIYGKPVIDDAVSRINKIYEEFGDLLNDENAKSEVPIIAKINNKTVSGKIDLLIVDENKVLVIDFKTGRKNDEHYQGQIELYKKALEKIYPKKEIKSQIIWI